MKLRAISEILKAPIYYRYDDIDISSLNAIRNKHIFWNSLNFMLYISSHVYLPIAMDAWFLANSINPEHLSEDEINS